MLTKLSRKDQKGFTLIELMIVIAIIGILAAIAIPQFSSYRKRGYNAAAQADLKNLATVEEAYYNVTFTYTNAVGDLTPLGFKTSAGIIVNITTANTTDFTATGYHAGGDVTWTVHSGGQFD